MGSLCLACVYGVCWLVVAVLPSCSQLLIVVVALALFVVYWSLLLLLSRCGQSLFGLRLWCFMAFVGW